MKILTDNIRTYRKLNGYMKSEILLLCVHVLISAGITVLLTKLQGVVFAVSAIATVMIAVKIFNLGAHYIMDIKTSTKYLIIILTDIVITILMFTYTVFTPEVWLYIILAMYAIHNMFADSFFIDYDLIIKKTVNDALFRHIQYLERFVFTISSILGAGISIVITTMIYVETNTSDITQLPSILVIYGVLYVIVTTVAISQYYRYYSDIDAKPTSSLDDDDGEGKVIMTLNEFKLKVNR